MKDEGTGWIPGTSFTDDWKRLVCLLFLFLFFCVFSSSFQNYMKCSQAVVKATCGHQTATFTRGFLDTMAGPLIQVIYSSLLFCFARQVERFHAPGAANWPVGEKENMESFMRIVIIVVIVFIVIGFFFSFSVTCFDASQSIEGHAFLTNEREDEGEFSQRISYSEVNHFWDCELKKRYFFFNELVFKNEWTRGYFFESVTMDRFHNIYFQKLFFKHGETVVELITSDILFTWHGNTSFFWKKNYFFLYLGSTRSRRSCFTKNVWIMRGK